MRTAVVLAVDDEPFNIDYICQELEDLPVDVISAENGQKALDMVKIDPPDLILLDIMMPGMDGFEVLARLKACANTQDIPVIVISASSDLVSVVKGIGLGAEDYLPKPFEPVLLKARIASSLEKKRLHDLEHLYLQSLERELEIARDIQKSFLPSELPCPKGWDLAVYFRAAREVAGDFYDVFLLPDGRLACVVGDVCGKGVGAALFMTLFRSLIRAAAISDVNRAKPGEDDCSASGRLSAVVSFTNKYIANIHADANMFAAVFFGIFDLDSGVLNYINCGAEHPLVLQRGGSVSALGVTGPVLGLLPEAVYGVGECVLNDGDVLLAFTDGVPDANNEVGHSFTHQRLLSILRDGSSEPAGLIGRIQRELGLFVGSAEQFDDITVLSIKKSFV